MTLFRKSPASMKLITRYILKEIFYYFLLFAVFCIVIMLTYEAYDTRKLIIAHGPSVMIVIKYLLFNLPDQLVNAMPIVGLMSTIFAYGILAKNREILAMVAAGVSFRRLSMPAVMFGVGLMVFTFWFGEYVVPVASKNARQLEKVDISGGDERVIDKRINLFEKGEKNRFYCVQGYIAHLQLMLFPTIIDLYPDGSGVERRIDADRAAPVTNPAGPDYWDFTNAEQRTFNRDGSLKSFDRFKSLQVQMEPGLALFLERSKEPEEMNFGDLKTYAEIIANKSDQSVLAGLWISLHKKLSFPVATLLMVLLGFAVVVDVHARHFTQGVALGLVVAVAYYVLNAVFGNFGQQQWLNPFFAGWGSVLIFAAVDYALYLRLHKIRL
ncbi:LptF/LptG family permease [bacterium]|nr:LptF/LptG family permease [bacterium]